MPNSRRQNLFAILMAPVWLVRFILFIIVMCIGMIVFLIPWSIFIGWPCLTIWFLSIFVGLVSPSVGHRMAEGAMEFGIGVMDWYMDGYMEPVLDFLVGD